jgi:hypothetical protein
VASVPWQDACMAGAPPHDSLGAHAPSHAVPADNAGVLVVRSVAVRLRSISLAVLPISLSRQLPAACWFRESRPAGGELVRSCAFSLVGRVAFPWATSLG